MKINNRLLQVVMLLFVLSPLAGCGQGGTETGTTGSVPFDMLTFGTRVEGIASSLVPDIDSEAGGASISTIKAITYETDEDWQVYQQATNVIVLEDIFGPEEDNAPVTRIRVLLNQFKSIADNVFTEDPNVACEGGSQLDEGDSIDIAFFGAISNGTADDRYYDCIYENSAEEAAAGHEFKMLYGLDSSNIARVVYMSDWLNDNTEEVNTRGNLVRNLEVTQVVFSEAEADGVTNGYLDLRYNQATLYSGVDDQHGTDDDITFKSRSRITGVAVLSSSGEVQVGTGDFKVIKYDEDISNIDSNWHIITNQSIGRGSYGDGSYSLFNINSDSNTELEDVAGIYCLQSSANNLPSSADSTNCTSLEGAYPWSGSDFPFALLSAIEESFESKVFFEANDTDLIASDSSNFQIPDYDTVSEEVVEE